MTLRRGCVIEDSPEPSHHTLAAEQDEDLEEAGTHSSSGNGDARRVNQRRRLDAGALGGCAQRRFDRGFAEQGRFFFTDQIDYDSAAVENHLRAPGMDEHLLAFDAAIAALDSFDVVSTEAALRAVAAARSVKAGSLIHAVRVAVTGKTVSPGLFEVVSLLGRDAVHARLIRAVRLFTAPRS